MTEEKKKDRKNRGPEKPISLWGASFRDVMGALLKTKPMPKEKDKESASPSKGA